MPELERKRLGYDASRRRLNSILSDKSCSIGDREAAFKTELLQDSEPLGLG